jgi:hypothetical protein
MWLDSQSYAGRRHRRRSQSRTPLMRFLLRTILGAACWIIVDSCSSRAPARCRLSKRAHRSRRSPPTPLFRQTA